jgi:hypothetical protein
MDKILFNIPETDFESWGEVGAKGLEKKSQIIYHQSSNLKPQTEH